MLVISIFLFFFVSLNYKYISGKILFAKNHEKKKKKTQTMNNFVLDFIIRRKILEGVEGLWTEYNRSYYHRN